MERRSFLAAVGGTTLGVGLAGCTGSGGDSGGDNANANSNNTSTETPVPTPEYDVDTEAPGRVKLLAVSFPGEVAYGDRFEGEVVFANVGGETVEGNAELELTRLTTADVESQTAELNTDGLESGESRSHTIGMFAADAAGDYRVEPGPNVYGVADGVEPLLAVDPVRRDLNTEIETPEGVRYTVTDVQFEQSLLAGGDNPRLRKTLEDRIVAVFSVEVANATTEGVRVSDVFTLSDGSLITDIDDPVLEGSELIGQQVNPGESISGWVAYAVPKADVPELSLGLNVAASGGEPDVRVDVSRADPSFPAFAIADQALPEQFNDGPTEFSFEIENTGEGTGVFRGYMEFLFPEDPGLFSSYQADTWYSLDGSAVTAEIPPGDTRTVTITDYDNDIVNYRFQPMMYEFSVTPA